MFSLFKKPAFGLDISDYSIEVLELEKKFGKTFLGAYNRLDLDEGIVQDGKIVNKEQLKEKIKKLLINSLPRKIKTKKVIFSVPESKTFFCILELSVDISKKELDEAVESEAVKKIPLNPGSYYSDFKVVSKNNDFQEILYAVASKEIINEYVEISRDVGLELVALDIESASLARAFEFEITKSDPNRAALIVDIGGKITVLTIVDSGLIRLSATIPVAGDNFTQAISRKLNIPLREAEKLKISCGLDPDKEKGNIMLILQSVLQDIVNEIKKSISFYEEKSGKKIRKILLCGGSSFLPKLPFYIEANLGITTKVPDPWKGIDVEILFKIKKIRNIIKTRLHPVFFANVIGLAKRGLEKNPGKIGINLMPSGKN